MYKEYFITIIYRDGECTREYDKIDIITDPCPERSSLLRTCCNYQKIDSRSTIKKTVRSGHDHNKNGNQKKNDFDEGKSLDGISNGKDIIVVQSSENNLISLNINDKSENFNVNDTIIFVIKINMIQI